MAQHEIRNIKGEVVQDTEEKGEWYHFSANTWFLIGGLILFNFGCFFSPSIVDGLFRILDFRLWSWWYFIVLIVIVGFSIKWFLLFQSWDDLDPVDTEIGKLFFRMSMTITIEMLFFVLLSATGLMYFLSRSLWQWFTYGAYSHMAALAFLLICVALAATYYVVKEWFIVKFQS